MTLWSCGGRFEGHAKTTRVAKLGGARGGRMIGRMVHHALALGAARALAVIGGGLVAVGMSLVAIWSAQKGADASAPPTRKEPRRHRRLAGLGR